jgi:hypothetical protein
MAPIADINAINGRRESRQVAAKVINCI